MFFYLKILISLITIINTVGDHNLFWPRSVFNRLVINNQIIVRSKRPRRPRKPRKKPKEPQQKKSTCPKNSDNLEILVADLMLDLPGYVNREIQRDRQPNQDYLKRNIIIAGRPEFEPLPIEYTPFLQEDIHQAFLTTLERQYRDSQVVEVQKFHWLFVRRIENKWELVTMFSIVENSPEDSSNGVFARGIRAWLKGCYFQEKERRRQESEGGKR